MKLYDVISKEQKEQRSQKKPLSAAKERAVQPPEERRPTYDIDEPIKKTTHVVHDWKYRTVRLLIVAGILGVVTALYVVGLQLVRAHVSITQRRIPFDLQATTIDIPNESVVGGSKLAFQVLTVPATVSMKVYATELAQTTSKAQGTVTIVNEYSTTAQAIPAGTTLTAKTKKKYTTNRAVVVPGFTTVNKKKVAGTVSVPVTAVAAGTDSAVTSTTFTVAGFETTKTKTLYARSAGAITGGGQSTKHTLSDTDRAMYTDTLRRKLENKLAQQTSAVIAEANSANEDHPEKKLITYPSLQTITIDPAGMVLQGDSLSFEASVKGVMVSYLLPEQFLEQKIASYVLSDKTITSVSIPGITAMKIDPIGVLPVDPARLPGQIALAVSGQETIITTVSEQQIKDLLVGSSRKGFDEKIRSIPNIQSARFELYPFWASFFPTKTTSIGVTIE